MNAEATQMAQNNNLSQKLETMLLWIQNHMITERWYDMKTDDAYNSITILMSEGLIPDCEMDAKQMRFRKVTLEYPIPVHLRKNELN